MEIALVVELARRMAEGLGEAHGKGLVHRDLKPTNVMVTPAGQVKILDFGLAKEIWQRHPAAEVSADDLTSRGMLVGTVHAMSPEQAGGGAVDHRSDLFAFGSMLYEMLSGTAPFRGPTVLDTLRRVMTLRPPSIQERVDGVPPALARLLDRLLQKEPDQRPQSALQVAAELARIGRTLGTSTPPTSTPRPSAAALGDRSSRVAADPDLPTSHHPSPGALFPERPEDPRRPAGGSPVPRRSHWTLVESLGEGGFGEVWLARHKSGREGVFKFCFEAERLRALKREVTLFRLLRETLGEHRNIARLLDWDFEEAPYFLEMEYSAGGSLELWARRRGGLGEVPLPVRLALVAEVADALAAAHSVGVLHKDVKPQNVLVAHDADGRPLAQLTDFGIGLLTDPEQLGEQGFTVQGFTASLVDAASSTGGGTVRYMAPELLEGKPATIQADIYALGVLLYQMVVGDFGRAFASGWRREIDDEFLIDDIAACVDGAPEHRLASAGELAARLRSLEERRAQRQAAARKQREQSRNRRRWRLLKTAAAVASLLLVLVSFFAYQTLQAKGREEQARAESERRRRQAEKLIDFMLGDLRQELQPIGKLDLLDQVGDRAMEYFADVPEGELTPEEMASYAKALHQIGQVRFARGRIVEATEAFAEGLAMAQRLATRDQNNTVWQFELGQSHFWLGFLHWKERDLDAAIEQFEAYRRISEALVSRNPQNEDWQLELAYSHSNIGSVLEERGQPAQAAVELNASAQIMERLSAGKGDGHPLLVESAHVIAKLGRSLQSQGHLAEAQTRYQEHLNLIERASTAAPEDMQRLRFLGIAHSHLGDLAWHLGDLDATTAHYQTSLHIMARVAGNDPENLVWKAELALHHNKLGRAFLAAGDLKTARRHLEQDQALVQTLLQSDPTHGPWQLAQGRSRFAWARFWFTAARLDLAHREAIAALETLQGLNDGTLSREETLWAVFAGWFLGEIETTRGNLKNARRTHENALRAARSFVEQYRQPLHLDLLARLLVALDQHSEAQPLIAELYEIGYRQPDFLTFAVARSPDGEPGDLPLTSRRNRVRE